MLQALWQISVAMAAASTATMLLLILRRLALNHLQARHAARRRAMVRAVLAFLEAGEVSGSDEAVGGGRAPLLLSEVASELFRLVRGDDVERLVDLLETSGSVDHLVRLTRHRQADKRLSAVETLTFLPGGRSLATLSERLADRDPDVRIAAALGLAQRDAIVSVGALLEGLGIGPGTISPLYQTLFRALSPQHNAELVALLGSDQNESVRLLILDALGQGGDYRVLPALIGATRDPNPEVRAAALRALSRLDHPRARQAIIDRLTDAAWPVRLQAATCCGQLGLTEAVEAVAALLSDLQWWVRYRAAEALARLGPAGRAALECAAADSAALRGLAATVLRQAGMPS